MQCSLQSFADIGLLFFPFEIKPVVRKTWNACPSFFACNYHVWTRMRASSMIVLGIRFIFNHRNLVSVSLKLCDYEKSVSSWLLARSAWVTSNKHVVRERGRGRRAEQPPWRCFQRTSLRIWLELTPNYSCTLCNTDYVKLRKYEDKEPLRNIIFLH